MELGTTTVVEGALIRLSRRVPMGPQSCVVYVGDESVVFAWFQEDACSKAECDDGGQRVHKPAASERDICDKEQRPTHEDHQTLVSIGRSTLVRSFRRQAERRGDEEAVHTRGQRR